MNDKNIPDLDVKELEIDYTLINQAVQQGIAMREKRTLLRGNLIFILSAIGVLAMLGMLIISGNAAIVSAIIGLAGLVSPVFIPITIMKQAKGGLR